MNIKKLKFGFLSITLVGYTILVFQYTSINENGLVFANTYSKTSMVFEPIYGGYEYTNKFSGSHLVKSTNNIQKLSIPLKKEIEVKKIFSIYEISDRTLMLPEGTSRILLMEFLKNKNSTLSAM